MPFPKFEVIAEHFLEVELGIDADIARRDDTLPSSDDVLAELGGEAAAKSDVTGGQHHVALDSFVLAVEHAAADDPLLAFLAQTLQQLFCSLLPCDCLVDLLLQLIDCFCLLLLVDLETFELFFDFLDLSLLFNKAFFLLHQDPIRLHQCITTRLHFLEDVVVVTNRFDPAEETSSSFGRVVGIFVGVVGF